MSKNTIKMTSKSLFNSGLNASVPDLTTSDKYKYRSGFPPGTTVDELWIYRRKKRPDDQIEDQIPLNSGSFENIRSEYNKKFPNYFQIASSNESISLKDLSPLQLIRPEDNLGLLGEHDMRPMYNEQYQTYPFEKSGLSNNRILPPRSSIQFAYNGGDNTSDAENINNGSVEPNIANRKNYTESQSKFSTPHMTERRSLKRRKSTLKLEGKLSTKTEQAEKFIEYLISQTLRPPIARKKTTLKLEGKMDTKTEFRDKFVPINIEPRPPLAKRRTNLQLEGELDILTENLEKYIAFELQQRPPLEKKHTNLHMEGDMYLEGEYAAEFIPYQLERVTPKRPLHNLKIDGTFYDIDTENKSKFITHDIHPQIPFLRQSRSFVLGSDEPRRYAEYKEKYISHPRVTRSLPRRPVDYFKPQEGQFDSLSEHKREYMGKSGPRAEISKFRANIQLEGTMDLTPEYQNSYQTHRLESVRPLRRRTVSDESNLKSEGSMDTTAEYKASFINFPRKRPNIRRPIEQLHYSKGHVDHMIEKKAQYIKHPNTIKVKSLKRPTELQLEGNFECQPEYRKAYIDYLVRERVERKPRPLDHMGILEEPMKISKKDVANNNVLSTGTDTSSSLPLTVIEKVLSDTTSPITKSLIPVLIPSSRSPSPSMDRPPQSPSPSSKSRRPPNSGKPSRIPTSTDSSSSNREHIAKPNNLPKSKPSRDRLSPIPTPKGRSSPRNRLKDIIKPPHVDRTGSRFSSPVRVEDLAYVPATSPIPLNVLYPRESKKKWTTTGSKSEDQAFYIIDKDYNNRREINNNDFGGFNDAISASKARSLYREQKWMPSWSHSSFD